MMVVACRDENWRRSILNIRMRSVILFIRCVLMGDTSHVILTDTTQTCVVVPALWDDPLMNDESALNTGCYLITKLRCWGITYHYRWPLMWSQSLSYRSLSSGWVRCGLCYWTWTYCWPSVPQSWRCCWCGHGFHQPWILRSWQLVPRLESRHHLPTEQKWRLPEKHAP